MKLGIIEIRALKKYGLDKTDIGIIKERLWLASFNEFSKCLNEHNIKRKDLYK